MVGLKNMTKIKPKEKCQKCGQPPAWKTNGIMMLGGWKWCEKCRQIELDKITKVKL
jgi:hypothetical protein